MNQLNRFGEVNFTCDRCGNNFQNEIAYSVAQNWEELDENHTYCENCVKEEEEKIKKQTQPKSKNKKNWGAAPINETSENTKSLEIDKRTLRKTGRTTLFGTRVKQEWITKLKSIAYEERLHYNETLEKALDCYDKHRRN